MPHQIKRGEWYRNLLISILREISDLASFGSVFGLMRKRPALFFVIIMVYTSFVMSFIFVKDIQPRLHHASVSDQRIADLTKELEAQRRIVAALTSGTRTESVLHEIQFKENWTEELNAKASRTLDYVNYAFGKGDLDYARRQLSEATELQGSLTAGYWLVRIDFASRDFEGAKNELDKLLLKDKEMKYPILRFYGAIICHELGKEDEVISLLDAYLAARTGLK